METHQPKRKQTTTTGLEVIAILRKLIPQNQKKQEIGELISHSGQVTIAKDNNKEGKL